MAEEDLSKVESWREWHKDFSTYVERARWYVREVGIPLKVLGRISDYPTTAEIEKFVERHESDIRKAWSDKQSVVLLKQLIESFLIEKDIAKRAGLPDPVFVEIRMLRDMPAIIGSDLNTYGPFFEGRVYAIPKENARLFIKQGVAVATRKEAEKPTLKEMFQGEVLTPYIEAAVTRPLVEEVPQAKSYDELKREFEGAKLEVAPEDRESIVWINMVDIQRVEGVVHFGKLVEVIQKSYKFPSEYILETLNEMIRKGDVIQVKTDFYKLTKLPTPEEMGEEEAKEIEAHVFLLVEKAANTWEVSMNTKEPRSYNGEAEKGDVGIRGFDRFSDLMSHLESGEECIDVWYDCLRQIGSEEMCREELTHLPAPFNTENMVRAFWKFEEVQWTRNAKDDLDAWQYKYIIQELEAHTIEKLKRICKIKTGHVYDTKSKLISAILEAQEAKPKPEVPIPTITPGMPLEEKKRLLLKRAELLITQIQEERKRV